MIKNALIATAASLLLSTTGFSIDSKYERRVDRAADNLENVISHGNPIHEALLQQAECVTSIRLYKAGFIYGAKVGKGVTSCRLEDGSWSAPSMTKLTGLSAGLQVGVAKVDLLFFVLDKNLKDLLIDGAFGLDLGANVTVWNDELNGEIEFDQPVYSVVNSKGVFAGLTLEGTYLKQVDRSNENVYGREYTSYEILNTDRIISSEVSSFTSLLNFYTR